MNSLAAESIFMRSLATRRQHLATSAVLKDVIDLYQLAGFDLVIIETAGIGQSDTEIVELCDLSVYVMTAEYGAASQLEKIDMLDFADLVVLNKSEKRGAADALRDVRKQWRRNHAQQQRSADDELPVYPTIASRFNDPGVNRLFAAHRRPSTRRKIGAASWQLSMDTAATSATPPRSFPARVCVICPKSPKAGRALGSAHREAEAQAVSRAPAVCARRSRASAMARCRRSLPALTRWALDDPSVDATRRQLRAAYNAALDEVGAKDLAELAAWPGRVAAATRETYSYPVRGREVKGENYTESLSRLPLPKLAVPTISRLGRDPALHQQGKSAGRLSLYRRRVSLPARGGRSDPNVCRRGRAGAHQSPLSLSLPAATVLRASRPHSIRRRSMARIRTRARTSMGAPATRASPSQPSTTSRSSTPDLICRRRPRRCR